MAKIRKTNRPEYADPANEFDVTPEVNESAQADAVAAAPTQEPAPEDLRSLLSQLTAMDNTDLGPNATRREQVEFAEKRKALGARIHALQQPPQAPDACNADVQGELRKASLNVDAANNARLAELARWESQNR